jgi:hypothetical protein
LNLEPNSEIESSTEYVNTTSNEQDVITVDGTNYLESNINQFDSELENSEGHEPQPPNQQQTFSYQQQAYEYASTAAPTTLDYYITAAIQPANPQGSYAYLINGYTNTGYWYQVGLSYDWYWNATAQPGFKLLYEVFDPDGFSEAPGVAQGNINNQNSVQSGGQFGSAGTIGFDKPVNPGDPIEIKMSIIKANNGQPFVFMEVDDLKTGAEADFLYNGYSATNFVPISVTPGTKPGFFTGPMTEGLFNGLGPFSAQTYTPASQMSSSLPSSYWPFVFGYLGSHSINTVPGAPITPSSNGGYILTYVDPSVQPYTLPSGATAYNTVYGEELSSDGTLITGINPHSLDIGLQYQNILYGQPDTISVTGVASPADIVKVFFYSNSKSTLLTSLTGTGNLADTICSNPSSSTCLAPGTYIIEAYDTNDLEDVSIPLTITSSGGEPLPPLQVCAQAAVPVSGLVPSGSDESSSIKCLCPNTEIYVNLGQQCPTSQVCPPGSSFSLAGGTSGAPGCGCLGSNQLLPSGTSSCPAATAPTCLVGESVLPNGLCGCTNGIPNAQGVCTVCPSSVPALNAANGQYYCASANPPQCSALTASSNQECVCNNVNMVQNPSMCTAPPKPPLCEDATSGQSCSCTSSGTIVSDPSLCGLPSCDSVGSGQACICADGTTVTDLNDCPAPTCDDGNTAPSTGCVTCPDGSTASSLTNCPSSVGGGNSTGGGNNTNIPPSEDADVVARTKLCTNPLTAWECNWFSGI